MDNDSVNPEHEQEQEENNYTTAVNLTGISTKLPMQ